MIYKAFTCALLSAVSNAQWGAIAKPDPNSCGNHFDPNNPHPNFEVDEHAQWHYEQDLLTIQKEMQEAADDQFCKTYGLGRC